MLLGRCKAQRAGRGVKVSGTGPRNSGAEQTLSQVSSLEAVGNRARGDGDEAGVEEAATRGQKKKKVTNSLVLVRRD